MDAVSVWVFSVWLSIHLFLTAMELRKWHSCVCAWVSVIGGYWRRWVTSSQGDQGAADYVSVYGIYLCTYVCPCIHMNLLIHIMYHMHNMFSYEFVHTSKDRSPCQHKWAQHIPKKKPRSWKMRGHRCWDRKPFRPSSNKHCGILHSGLSTSDIPHDVQRLNS